MIRRIFTALTLYACIADGTGAVAADATTDTSALPDTGTIQEVVVTARRFAENLQNVPIAVTALGTAMLEEQGRHEPSGSQQLRAEHENRRRPSDQ